jgi:hypothetical protein
LGDSAVATPVRFDLIPPEFHVGTRQILAAAAMPEAAVHEHRQLPARPCEVGLARDGPMLAISADAGRPQELSKGQFGRSVAARVHGRHDFGPDFLLYVVHLAPLPFYRFP